MSRTPLHLVVDANIPCAPEAFAGFGQVERVPGEAITPATLAGADVLLVRSVTRVDEALLGGSLVRFVGSATIGTDHVDRKYLDEAGISFAHAPGSNAQSVVEYVLAALLVAGARRGAVLRDQTVGVVGCGHVGGALAARLEALGARVLRNDPPRAEAAEAAGLPHDFVPLATVLAASDVVTLHPPLTRSGPHPTYHLIGAAELAAMRPDALLVNASRGAVVDNAALRDALEAGRIGSAVLDVWEHEPTPDPGLLRLAAVATPHIAGYSRDGKVTGTAMLHDALAEWLGAPVTWDAERALAEEAAALAPLAPPGPGLPETAYLDALARQAYDLRADDARMRGLLDLPAPECGAAFHRLRRTYPCRFGWARHRIAAEAVPPELRTAVVEGLGLALG